MGRRSKNASFLQAYLNNNNVFNYWVSLLYNLYTSAYKWEGLEEIPGQFIEESLIKHGIVCFTEEEYVGMLGLPAVASSRLSPYGIPYRWRLFGRDGLSMEVDNRDCVYCFSTNNKYQDMQAIYMFAARLTEVTRSIDVNIKHQRHPGVVRTNEENKLTYENILLKVDGGEPDILVDKDLDLDAFQHIDYKIPYTADKLEYTARDILADALNYIGVQYSSSNKRERLASTEIDSNIGYTAACRMMHLTPRQDAAKRLSKKFGRKVTVDINDGFVNMLKIADINPNGEQMSQGTKALYDSSSGERG